MWSINLNIWTWVKPACGVGAKSSPKKTLLMASRFKKLNPKLNVVCVKFHITIIFYTQCVYISERNVDW